MTWQTLDPRARYLFYLQALGELMFWAVATLVGATFASRVVPFTWLAGGVAAFSLLLLVRAVWLPWLSYDRWAFAVRAGDLVLSRGLIFRQVTAIPMRRIQHVDVRQGPFERLLGLSSVVIYTGSGMGADGVIPGLLTEEAGKLRDQLVAVSGDDGV